MPQDPLALEDLPGSRDGHRILRMDGPITISNLYEFQSRVRADRSSTLILDLTKVPYMDSAGIGALVGAYVTHQKEGSRLLLVGVNERVLNALKVTRVEQFFSFFETLESAEQAS
ncbi:MAG: anti-sigma factor antagonist [Blastocatellia bacterium]|jgi:anti-sigma B factor antagonist|nr:anti-sigma factor antagonist [Blastocatellia bacterium]